jgi:SAM-dependent methyltransferase
MDEPYFRPTLVSIYRRGFGHHGDLVAPGVLSLLEPVRAAGGTVLELGCGTGVLTRRLLEAGHRVIATDASPAMLAQARTELADLTDRPEQLDGPELDLRRITLPDDPLPPADAVVAVGHPLNYLPDVPAFRRALAAAAGALRPGGVLLVDVADLEWAGNAGNGPIVKVEEDWVWVNRVSAPRPDRYLREITTFVRQDDGTWLRDDERHENVLVDTALVPGWLAEVGVSARVGLSFGDEQLPAGLRAVVGHAR